MAPNGISAAVIAKQQTAYAEKIDDRLLVEMADLESTLWRDSQHSPVASPESIHFYSSIASQTCAVLHKHLLSPQWPVTLSNAIVVSESDSSAYSSQTSTPPSSFTSPPGFEQSNAQQVQCLLFTEALKEIASTLCCEFNGLGLDTLVAVESLFNIDSVLGWLSSYGVNVPVDTSKQPVEALASLLESLCRLRVQMESQESKDPTSAEMGIPLRHIYCYVHRFNSLSKARCLEPSWLAEWEVELNARLRATGEKPEQIAKKFIKSQIEVLDY